MQFICRIDEIEDRGARGFTLAGDPPVEGFLVRDGIRVYAYVNSCPHIGTPLDFLPDRFLTADRREILCSTHGARFEIASGRCTAGPCRGRSLIPLQVINEDGRVLVAADAGVG
jgi:nitrite reductase/ring-hydroxylating ferredoxin subunit